MSSWSTTICLPKAHFVGGVTSWALRLARSLAEDGAAVNLVLHPERSHYRALEPDRRLDVPGLNVIEAPALDDPAQWPKCVALYRELLPTLLLPNLLAESYGVAAALTSVHPERLRVVAWSHSDNPYDYTYLTYYAPLIHAFVPVSRQCEYTLKQRLPTRATDIHHLPYGIPAPPVRERPPVARRPLRLVYAGRLAQDVKRVFDLVALATELDRRGVSFELRLVGDGPQADELRQRAAAAQAAFGHAENRVAVEPPVPHEEIERVWSWADVSLLTSSHEGFSISMAESMMAGCVPVVSRVASGVAEIIRERETGLTFPIGAIPTMAQQVAWLASDATRLATMSPAARAAVQDYCGYERYFARVRTMFERAIAAPPRPWSPRRSLLMNGETAGGGTVPDDAPDRLRRVLTTIAQRGEGPIAIYGAGHHTVALAEVWARCPVPVVAVIDDDPTRHGDLLWGWPVGSIEHAAERGARAVVISSWLHERAIWDRQRASLENAGFCVYRLYVDNEESLVEDSPGALSATAALR
jgi:glycosyltransferase involved in cell wall biosynthesis